MSLLSGDGAALLSRIFSRLYVSGTVIAVTTTYDQVGEPTAVETETPARVQVDAMTEAMRGQDGAADSDRRILVLAPITFDTDAVIAVNEGPYAGSRWLVMTTANDPCLSYTEARCRRRPN